jgi:hypothetical protein
MRYTADMRRIFWAIIFLSLYFHLTSSGKDQFLLEKGKALYEAVLAWLEDADLDFHVEKESSKKPARRWR